MSARSLIGILTPIAAIVVLSSANARHAIARPQDSLLERDTGAVIVNVLSAWQRADARGIAAQYELDGDFVSPTGDHAVGRPAIEAFYGAAFKGGYAGSGAAARIVHARALSAAFALIDGCWTIEPRPESKIKEMESGLFVAVLHRHDRRWWIVALREQTGAQKLRELN